MTNSIYSINPLLQIKYSTTNSVVTCSTAMPRDDTIPQNTEGDEVLTVTITPKYSTSILEIIFTGNVQGDAATAKSIQTALFQDSTVNALCAATSYFESVGNARTGYLRHVMTSGTTSSTTFKIRIGPDAGTLYVNGDDTGNRIFGGVCSTTLLVREYYS